METNAIEFFVDGAHELWMRGRSGEVRRFLPGEVETTRRLADLLRRVYPEVYDTLAKHYSKSKNNQMFYRYKIVSRFVRCNMGEDDLGRFDIEGDKINLEQTRCPLKGSGDCPFENVVCNPKANGLTDKEREVVTLYAQGLELGKIASLLGKKITTVKDCLAKVKKRFGLERTRDIVMLAYILNLI